MDEDSEQVRVMRVMISEAAALLRPIAEAAEWLGWTGDLPRKCRAWLDHRDERFSLVYGPGKKPPGPEHPPI
jgi:hypothetical protein